MTMKELNLSLIRAENRDYDDRNVKGYLSDSHDWERAADYIAEVNKRRFERKATLFLRVLTSLAIMASIIASFLFTVKKI